MNCHENQDLQCHYSFVILMMKNTRSKQCYWYLIQKCSLAELECAGYCPTARKDSQM